MGYDYSNVAPMVAIVHLHYIRNYIGWVDLDYKHKYLNMLIPQRHNQLAMDTQELLKLTSMTTTNFKEICHLQVGRYSLYQFFSIN